MTRVVGRVEDIGDSIEISTNTANSSWGFEPARPVAIVAACLVALALFWLPILDPDVVDSLALRYGWPLSLRLKLDVMLQRSAIVPSRAAFRHDGIRRRLGDGARRGNARCNSHRRPPGESQDPADGRETLHARRGERAGAGILPV